MEDALGSSRHDFIQFALDWHHLPEELRPFVYSTMRAYILTPQAPGKGGISLPHSRAIFSKLQNEDKDLFFLLEIVRNDVKKSTKCNYFLFVSILRELATT